MTGVLLVNMGGANSPKELKMFLARMFKDPFILPFGKPGRNLLSFIISNTRYRKSWKKYQMIGGSPIIDATQKTMFALQEKLDNNFKVKIAFSYTSPLLKESIKSFMDEGINEITVIPLYPQSSYSTTSSVEKDVSDEVVKNINIRLNFIKEFYKQESFVDFWSMLIANHIEKNKYINPYLLFSAHSIPKYLLEKGDTYPSAVESSAKAIADKLGHDYEYAFQSGMKRGKWIGPDINDCLRKLSIKGREEIVIIPVSFVNENLETLFDIDKQIIPFAKNELGIKTISRVAIPVADGHFIKLLKEIVEGEIVIKN